MCNQRTSCVHLVKHGRLDSARQLLLDCRYMDLELQGEEEDGTALHWACSQGYSDIIDVLLQLGANVNARTKCGLTPLHCACGRGNVGIVRTLLQWGADVKAQSDRGDTSCHVAAYKGHREILCSLFKFRANPLVLNHQGRDALTEAIANHQWDVVNFLRRILGHKSAGHNSAGHNSTGHKSVGHKSVNRQQSWPQDASVTQPKVKVTVTSDPQSQLQYQRWQEIGRQLSLDS